MSDFELYDYVEGVGLVSVTHGEWVRFADVEAKLKELEGEYAALSEAYRFLGG